MTQYLLSVHHAGSGPDLTEEEMRRSFADVDACNQELMDAGAFVFAGGLLPPDSATTVRQSAGEVAVTDGPYLETKEYMASFYLFDVESEERAYQLAAEMPWADQAPTEVWPILHEAARDA